LKEENLKKLICLLCSTKNWFIFFFFHSWKKFIKNNIKKHSLLITFEEDFITKAYPNPKVELPSVLTLSNFRETKQTKTWEVIRFNSIISSKLMISLFQFSYWIPMSYDFIIWRRLTENYIRYKHENPPKYRVNCDYSLQINYDSNFDINYTNNKKGIAQLKKENIHELAFVNKWS
jgi:hypothetical protein